MGVFLFYPDVFGYKSLLKDRTINLQQAFSKQPELISDDIKGKILQNMLFYDSIYINGWDLPILIHMFNGRENAEHVTSQGIIRLLNCRDIFIGCKKKGYFYTIAGGNFTRDIFKSEDEINHTLQTFRGNYKDYIEVSRNLYKNRLNVETNDLIKKISKEIERDIEQEDFQIEHDIKSTRATHIFSRDLPVINTQLEAYRRIYIAERADLNHIFSEDILTEVIKSKIFRSKVTKDTTRNDINHEFNKLTKVMKVPDVVEAVKAKAITTKEILNIRESKNCIEFRTWLHSNAPFELSEKENQNVISAYIDSLGKKDLIDKLPTKLTRFISSTVIDVLIGGLPAAAFVDSFIIEKMRSWKPSFFIDDYSNILEK
jgi:hypothetical protein